MSRLRHLRGCKKKITFPNKTTLTSLTKLMRKQTNQKRNSIAAILLEIMRLFFFQQISNKRQKHTKAFQDGLLRRVVKWKMARTSANAKKLKRFWYSSFYKAGEMSNWLGVNKQWHTFVQDFTGRKKSTLKTVSVLHVLHTTWEIDGRPQDVVMMLLSLGPPMLHNITATQAASLASAICM